MSTNLRRGLRGPQILDATAMSGVFEDTGVAHARRPLAFFSDTSQIPTANAVAAILSPTPDDTDISEALEGARWLGLDLLPQGVEIAQVMQALGEDGHPLYETTLVEIPRRSTKTTAVNSVLLGRCLNRPGYRVASTAQDGLRARAKLREILQSLQAAGFEADGHGRMFFAAGMERIEFTNGSVWKSLSPDPTSFRSDAFDAILVDEAGELDPEKAEALLAGILPTQDTRPDSQTIVAGTPGVSRAGLLWETLEQLRAGSEGVGGVVYELHESETVVDYSDPDRPVLNVELLMRTHPGISSGLTSVKKVVSRVEKMGIEKWTREYLCQWPLTRANSALDIQAWKDCGTDEEPVRPEKCGIAFDVSPDGGDAALVAAWRDDQGRACFEVLAAHGGTDWLPSAAQEAQTLHRGALSFDAIGQNLDPADKMQRPPYRLRLAAIKPRDLVGAAARVEKEIKARNCVHYQDPELTEAVEGASWRPMGKDGRLFARKASANSVAALVAASEALWAYDTAMRAGSARPRVRSSAALKAVG